MNYERVTELPNSTYLVHTAVGDVLVNSPPETLKYILARGLDVPQMILLPPDIPAGYELGSSGFVRQGINFASVEFLLYANFFGKQRRALLVTPTARQVERLHILLEETFVGPPNAAQYGKYGWLKRECAAVGFYPPFGRAPEHEDLCDIVSLEGGTRPWGDALAIEQKEGYFWFYEESELIAKIPTRIANAPRPLALAPARPLLRHELTLQFIGGSDGFDPTGITTCFIAYLGNDLHNRATLFDTAAYLRQRLHNLGLSTHQISEVVISHLHEDHLAGLPELLLMGDRIRLLTSDVIYDSLLRVLSAMLDLSPDDVAMLFEYHPLNPGQPVELEGRTFESLYAVHTIPTIAVRANGLYYSGDMRYDERWFDELVQSGTLTAERRDQLVTFAEGAKVLVQDAGGGAIHTTITAEVLEALAAKGQRVVLAHTSQADLPQSDRDWADRIEFARSGHITSIGPELQENGDAEQIEFVETMEANPLFARLSLSQIKGLAEQVVLCHLKKDEVLIGDGDQGDGYIYLVHAGLFELWSGEREQLLMLLGRGHSIGVRGALEGWYRMGTVVARGEAQVLRLTVEHLRPVMRHLNLEEAFGRADWLWRLAIFRGMLWSNMLDLALDFEPYLLSAGEPLFMVGELASEIYMLVSGRIKVLDEARQVIAIIEKPGTFFGGRGALYKLLRNASAQASQDSEVWRLPLAAVQRLQMVYPHLLMHLRAIEGSRTGQQV